MSGWCKKAQEAFPWLNPLQKALTIAWLFAGPLSETEHKAKGHGSNRFIYFGLHKMFRSDFQLWKKEEDEIPTDQTPPGCLGKSRRELLDSELDFSQHSGTWF